MSTRIEKIVLDQVRHHLESDYPYEACGLLLGHEQDGQRHITQVREVVNISTADQRRRFVIDPLDYLDAEKYAAREGLLLLGVYHSHPDHPAVPSQHDLEFAQPYFSYFIFSIAKGKLVEMKSYRLETAEFQPEPIEILDNTLHHS